MKTVRIAAAQTVEFREDVEAALNLRGRCCSARQN